MQSVKQLQRVGTSQFEAPPDTKEKQPLLLAMGCLHNHAAHGAHTWLP